VAPDLPATRASSPPARRADEPAARPAVPAPRFGRRLLGAALLVAALGLGSCHAFWAALLA
jgi:hypothetical protein